MTQERPNTIAGLKAKHTELKNLRERYLAEAKKLTVDIDHIDAAIRLFDPKADVYRLKEYVVKHRAQKGTVQRFVLQCLRDATEPLTSRQITEAWCENRGLVADEATYVVIRKRIGACLKKCEDNGTAKGCGYTKDHDGFGPYKLWVVAG